VRGLGDDVRSDEAPRPVSDDVSSFAVVQIGCVCDAIHSFTPAASVLLEGKAEIEEI